MGVNSTLYVSREKAIMAVQKELFKLSNEELSKVFDAFLDKKYYNSIISKCGRDDDIIDDIM